VSSQRSHPKGWLLFARFDRKLQKNSRIFHPAVQNDALTSQKKHGKINRLSECGGYSAIFYEL
jgi:hypothetical protein